MHTYRSINSPGWSPQYARDGERVGLSGGFPLYVFRNSQRTTAAIAPASLGPSLLPDNIGYQQDSLFDAAYPFRVPHDRRHLFILQSSAQQVIEKSPSAEPHFSAAKRPVSYTHLRAHET